MLVTLRAAGQRGPFLEQVRVRSRADEMQVVAIDLVDQQPIGLDMAFTVVLPVAAERVVPVSCRQGNPVNQQQNHLA